MLLIAIIGEQAPTDDAPPFLSGDSGDRGDDDETIDTGDAVATVEPDAPLTGVWR